MLAAPALARAREAPPRPPADGQWHPTPDVPARPLGPGPADPPETGGAPGQGVPRATAPPWAFSVAYVHGWDDNPLFAPTTVNGDPDGSWTGRVLSALTHRHH